MYKKLCSVVLAVALVLALSIGAGAAETASADKPQAALTQVKPVGAKESKVSISAKDTKVSEVLDSLAKQSKEKLVVETTVKGSIPALELKDVAFESALGTVCKAAKIEWRKVYIGSDSKLLEQPDRFAATVRLMSGLSFPDMVLAGSSMNKVSAHLEDKKAVLSAEESALKMAGVTKVYLITNDAAVAAKALAKDKEEKNAAVDKYASMLQDQMDMFMKMTPEEREQALLSSMNMMDQVGPEYMSAIMQTLANSDPESLRRMMNKQMDMLMGMSTDQRRAMMKFQMQAAKSISPEVQKMLQEDAAAIVKEMQGASANP